MTAYQHIFQGAGAPTTAPASVGAHYIDSTSKRQYLAVGTESAADWVLQPKAIQSSAIDGSGHLIITYSDNSTADLGLVKGGDGADGAEGRGITSVAIDGSGHLIITYSDTTTADLGLVEGADGANGADGRGITGASIDVNGHLIITFTDTTTADLGVVKGADGANGADGADGAAGTNGVGVQSVDINGNKHLIITLTNASTVDAGLLPTGAGLEVGDVLLTLRAPGTDWVAQGTTQLQASYPDLFAMVGLIGGTVNGGATWDAVAVNAGLDEVGGVTAGSDGVWCIPNWQGVIYRSADDGLTWSQIILAFGGEGYAPGKLFTDGAGTWMSTISMGGGYFRSTDNGATWDETVTDGPTISELCALGGGVWLRGGGEVLSRSTDNGLTWATVDDGVVASYWNPSCFAHDGNGTIVAAGTNGSGSHNFTRSTDNGLTWTSFANPIALNEPAVSIHYFDGVWMASGGQGKCVRSTDGGASWTQMNIGTSSMLAFAANADAWLALDGANIWRSTDGGANWSSTNYSSALFGGGYIGGLDGNSTTFIMAGTSTNAQRSASSFPYDAATEFKVPEVTAPAGTTAYLKAIG